MRHLAINLAIPHEPDLAWFLNHSAAAAGIRSSFGVLAEAAAGGWGGGRLDPHAGRTRGYRDKKTGNWRHPWIDAVSRERGLNARWGLVPDEHRAALVLAYTEEDTPAQTHGKLGQLFGVARLTAAFREVYEPWSGTVDEALVRACERSKSAKLVEAMRLQASALVEVAVRAWRETEPRARPHHVDEDTERRADAARKDVEGPRQHENPRTWVPLERTGSTVCAPRATRPEGALIVGRTNRVLHLADRMPGSEVRMRARGEVCEEIFGTRPLTIEEDGSFTATMVTLAPPCPSDVELGTPRRGQA